MVQGIIRPEFDASLLIVLGAFGNLIDP
eukprot:COSAG06_NODE_54431_length_294_cov_1.297436_1_plen_27_part_10